MKLINFNNYEHYVEAQRRTLLRRGAGPYFTSDSIKKIADWLKLRRPIFSSNQLLGICHGARNGLEADEFKKHFSSANVFGTDLFPFSRKSASRRGKSEVIKHDFSIKVRRWIGRFDFIFSNSLDHAKDPVKTLNVWLRQLNSNGYLFVHWSPVHIQASGGDCFGADLYEYIELMNSVGELVDLLYCKVIWSRKSILQRHGLETIALVVKPKNRK